MAIEDTGLLNSAIEIQDNSVVKNEGKTTIEKSIAGVSDQEFFNQREKVNLQKEGYSNLEINKHQKTNTIFPITNSFNLFKDDLEGFSTSLDNVQGLNLKDANKEVLKNDVENYKNYVNSFTKRNKEFKDFSNLFSPSNISAKDMMEKLGVKDRIKFIRKDEYQQGLRTFIKINFPGADYKEFEDLINTIGFVVSDNVNKVSKDGTARGYYMFGTKTNDLRASYNIFKSLNPEHISPDFEERVESGDASNLNVLQQMKLISSVIRANVSDKTLDGALKGNVDDVSTIMKIIYGDKFTEELQNKTKDVLEKRKDPEMIIDGDGELPFFLYRGEGPLNNFLEDYGFNFGSMSNFHKNLGRTQIWGRAAIANHAINLNNLKPSTYTKLIHELSGLDRNFPQTISDEVTVFAGDFPVYFLVGQGIKKLHNFISSAGHGFLRKYISKELEGNLLQSMASFSSVSFSEQVFFEMLLNGSFDDQPLSDIFNDPEFKSTLNKEFLSILQKPEFWKNQGFSSAKGAAMVLTARGMFKRLYPKQEKSVGPYTAGEQAKIIEMEKGLYGRYRIADKNFPNAKVFGPERMYREQLPMVQRFPFLGPNISNFTGQALGLSSADFLEGVITGKPKDFEDIAAKNLAFLFTVNVLTKGGRGLLNKMKREKTFDPEYGRESNKEFNYIEMGKEPPSARAKKVYLDMSKKDLKMQEIKDFKFKVNDTVIELPGSKVVDSKIIDGVELVEAEMTGTGLFNKENIFMVDLVSNLRKPSTEEYLVNKNADGTTTIKRGLDLELSIHSVEDNNGNVIVFTNEKQSFEDNEINPNSTIGKNYTQIFNEEYFDTTTKTSGEVNVKQRFIPDKNKSIVQSINEYRRMMDMSGQTTANNLIVESGTFPELSNFLTESTIFGAYNNDKSFHSLDNELFNQNAFEYLIKYVTSADYTNLQGGKVHIYEIDNFDYAFPAELLNKLVADLITKYENAPYKIELFWQFANQKTKEEDFVRLKQSQLGYLVLARKFVDPTDPGAYQASEPLAYIKPLDLMDSLRNQMAIVKNKKLKAEKTFYDAEQSNVAVGNINPQEQSKPFSGGTTAQSKYDKFFDGTTVGLDFIDALVLSAALKAKFPIIFKKYYAEPGNKGKYTTSEIFVSLWKTGKLTDITSQTRTLFHELFHFEDHIKKFSKDGELDVKWNTNAALWKEIKNYLSEAEGGGPSDFTAYGPNFNLDKKTLDAAIEKLEGYLNVKKGGIGRGDIVGQIQKAVGYISTELLDKNGNPVVLEPLVEEKLFEEAIKLAELEKENFESELSKLGLVVTPETITSIVNRTNARELVPPAIYEKFITAPESIKKRILVNAMKGLIDEHMKQVVDAINEETLKGKDATFDLDKAIQEQFAEQMRVHAYNHGIITKEVLMEEAMALSLEARPLPVHFYEVVQDAYTGDLKTIFKELADKDNKPVTWTVQEYMRLLDPSYWTDKKIRKLRNDNQKIIKDYENGKIDLKEAQEYYQKLTKYEVVWSSSISDFFRNYRGSAVEVYADVMSFMMVNPKRAAFKAPRVVEMVQRHLDSRPLFKEYFENIVRAVNEGTDARQEQAYKFAEKESKTNREKFLQAAKKTIAFIKKPSEGLLRFKLLLDDYFALSSVYIEKQANDKPDLYGVAGIEHWNPITGKYENLNKAQYIQFLQDNIKYYDTVATNFKNVYLVKHLHPIMELARDKGLSIDYLSAYVTFKAIAMNNVIEGKHFTPFQIISESNYTMEDFIDAYGKDIFIEGGKTQASLRSAENLVEYFERTFPELTEKLNDVFGQNGFVKQFVKQELSTSQLFGPKELDKILANPWYINFTNPDYLIKELEAGQNPFKFSKATKSKKGGFIAMPFDPLFTTIWKVQVLAYANHENQLKLALFSDRAFDGEYMASRTNKEQERNFYKKRDGQYGLFSPRNIMRTKEIITELEPGSDPMGAASKVTEYRYEDVTYAEHFSSIQLQIGDVLPFLNFIPGVSKGKAKSKTFWETIPKESTDKYAKLLLDYRKEVEAANKNPEKIEQAERAFNAHHKKMLEEYSPLNSDKGIQFFGRDRRILETHLVIKGNVSYERYLELPSNLRQTTTDKNLQEVYQELEYMNVYEEPGPGEKIMVMMEHQNYKDSMSGFDLGRTDYNASSVAVYKIVNKDFNFGTWKKNGEFNLYGGKLAQEIGTTLVQWQKSWYTTFSPAFLLPNMIIDMWSTTQNIEMNAFFPDFHFTTYDVAGFKIKVPTGFKDNSTSFALAWLRELKNSEKIVFTDEFLNIEKGLFAEGQVLPGNKFGYLVDMDRVGSTEWVKEYEQLTKDLENMKTLREDVTPTTAIEEFKSNPAKSVFEATKALINGQAQASKFSELHTRAALKEILYEQRDLGLNNYSDWQITQLVRRGIVDFKNQGPVTIQAEAKWPFLNVLKNILNASYQGLERARNFGYSEKRNEYGKRFYESHFVKTTVGYGASLFLLNALYEYEFFGEKQAFCRRFYKPFDKQNYLTLPAILCNTNTGQPMVLYNKVPLNTPVKLSMQMADFMLRWLIKDIRVNIIDPIFTPDRDPTRFDWLDKPAHRRFRALSNELPSSSGVLNILYDAFKITNPNYNPENSLTGQKYIKQDLMTAAQTPGPYNEEAQKELIIAKFKALMESYANPIGYDYDINLEGKQSRSLNSLYLGDFGLLAKMVGRFATTAYDDQSVYAEKGKIRGQKAWEQYKKRSVTTEFLENGWESMSDDNKARFYIEFVESTKNKQAEIMYRRKFGDVSSRVFSMLMQAKSKDEFYLLIKRYSQTLRGLNGNSAKDNATIKNVIENKNKAKPIRGRFD